MKKTSIGGSTLKQFNMDSIGSIKSTNGTVPVSTGTLKKTPSSSGSATKPKVSKPSSASSQASSSSTRSNNSTIGKKVAPKALEDLYEQSKKNPVVAKAKQKAIEAGEPVDKLAFETVVLEEELKKLKMNIMKDKEVRSTMP
ncbi:predicted protein [Naegleria gruberi]|uniref:Predicted protein n=1 Tax=Naegleria gruberi TaxID=5762 RepID=D2V2H7_NAEGR|nr:uncharacterized protein NAEGRDRAFT_63004 [Naegleria gruberi]EFC48901.1 predicted protein [Naegleria gruberi]|eukprot:XP_002681645.1 predicted protein [Naegleria gruberi strain NEG-M]